MGGAESGASDAELLAALRSMTPEERAALLAALANRKNAGASGRGGEGRK